MIITHPLKKYSFELVIIGILFVDLFLKSIPVLPLAFSLIVIQFLRLDLVSNIVISILFLPKFFGALMNSQGISGIGGYFIILGFFLILYGLSSKKVVLINYKYGLISLIILLFMFWASAKYTNGGDYAFVKWISTTQRGIIAFSAFVVLFSNANKVNTSLFGIYLIMYSFFLVRVSIDVNQIFGPNDLFDFGFMRNQTKESVSSDLVDLTISYHVPGYYALQGLSLFLMKNSEIKDNKPMLLLSILSFLIILYTGARQTFVILFALGIVWGYFNLKSKSKLKGSIVILSILLIVYYLYVSNEEIFDLFSATVNEGFIEGGNRGPWLLRGIDLFLENPIFGVGFGRFSIFGMYGTYPHNLIIELLCETGLFGFIFTLIITMFLLFKFKNSRNVQYNYTYLLFVYILSSMVSYNLETNIVLFSFIFALPALKKSNY